MWLGVGLEVQFPLSGFASSCRWLHREQIYPKEYWNIKFQLLFIATSGFGFLLIRHKHSEYIHWSFSQDQLEVCMKDWAELADEYRDLELRHKEYREVGCPCHVMQPNKTLTELLFSDLGKMHGPAKEMYKRSDPSGEICFLSQKYRLDRSKIFLTIFVFNVSERPAWLNRNLSDNVCI